MINVVVHGAEGRMGLLIADLVDQSHDLKLTALVTEPGKNQPAGLFHPELPLIGQDSMGESIADNSVIIDFSLPAALDGLLDAASATNSKLVIGTTGYSDPQLQSIKDFSKTHSVVLASNYSIGIPAIGSLISKLAEILPDGFMPELTETHHRHKIDMPSGTAKTLVSKWSDSRNCEKVPTHSLRIGGVIGEHKLTISDDEETIEITHRAHSRKTFLRGIIPAVKFVNEQSAGLFSMEDVLAQ
ncbi:MAG: 4-hydroxy-tetrahydrodipicolinate reductase [bacterium]|nr:4-hydroxy-tetrahydrodipicolinate reductase [bacterium]